MSDPQKTHYRKAFNSPYLSSADIVEPAVLTIEFVTLEVDRSKQSKDEFNTAHFAERELRPGEPLKPMILNATNSKKLAEITGSKWIEDWANVSVEVRVETGIQFGRDKVDGLRLAKAAVRPKAASPALVAAAKAAAAAGTPALRAWWQAQPEDARQLLAGGFKGLRAQAAAADEAAAKADADKAPAGVDAGDDFPG